MTDNTLGRIKQYLDFKGVSISAFEKSLSFSNGSFASQLKKNKTIGVDKLENILTFYSDINIEWLLTGVGSMIKGTEKPLKTTEKNAIPLVSVHAIGGFGNSSFAIQEKDVKAYYVVPKFHGCKVDFMIEVAGSSMYPKYNSGDIVACTIIKESQFIQWNKVHVIGTKEQGVLIKRLKKGAKSNFITAISDNKDYDPFEIPENEITGIALVIGVIRLE